MKKEYIKNYLSNINWNSDWSYKKIEDDLKEFLGETPAIKIDYKKDVLVNEMTGKAKEIEKVGKVVILFSDMNTTDDTYKMDKVEILL